MASDSFSDLPEWGLYITIALRGLNKVPSVPAPVCDMQFEL